MKQAFLSYLVITSIFASASGTEFQVNTRTSRNQANAAIAADANGNFVVVWNSYFEDANSNDIFGRLFDSGVNPVGDEFRINTTRLGNQKEPSVAADPAGNFVVVWQSKDGNDWDIFAQRFDANGTPVDVEFRVNDDPNGGQLHPKVAMSKTGAFAIVWERYEFFDPFDAWDVCGQLYDCNGLPVGAELKVNLLSQCRYPDVAMDGNGNFTVVWMQDDIYHTSNLVMARQCNADGTAKTEEPCEVSTGEFYTIAHPSIAMGGNGHFVVCWEGHPDSAAEKDIHARRYNYNGSALSQQFTVNTTTDGAQEYPEVAMNNQREFVIVWNSETEPGSNERDIFGQRYDSLWEHLGDEFQVNTYVVGDQRYPAVVIKEDGEFVTVWQSDGQDGSEFGIFGEFGPKKDSAELTGDGFVNFRDFCVLAEEWRKEGNPLEADLIDDNRIDEQDLGAFCEQWLTPLYECSEVDIDGDSKIDFKDYAHWAADWSEQGPNLDGDITGNGIVDMADLRALLFHWPQTCE